MGLFIISYQFLGMLEALSWALTLILYKRSQNAGAGVVPPETDCRAWGGPGAGVGDSRASAQRAPAWAPRGRAARHLRRPEEGGTRARRARAPREAGSSPPAASRGARPRGGTRVGRGRPRNASARPRVRGVAHAPAQACSHRGILRCTPSSGGYPARPTGSPCARPQGGSLAAVLQVS